MKSKKIPGRFYLECSCGSEDHLLVFDFFEYIPNKENIRVDNIAVFFIDSYKAPWYKRILKAFKYIFKIDNLEGDNSVCIDETNIIQLQEIVNYFKGVCINKQEEDNLSLRKKLKEIGFYCDEMDINQFHHRTMLQLINEVKKLKK